MKTIRLFFIFRIYYTTLFHVKQPFPVFVSRVICEYIVMFHVKQSLPQSVPTALPAPSKKEPKSGSCKSGAPLPPLERRWLPEGQTEDCFL